MDIIKSTLLVIAEIIDIIGVVILIFGFIKVLFNYVRTEFKDILRTHVRLLQQIRCELGIYLLLALDFLIASDIIHTIADLNQEQLIELSVMILLRTVIGYFLGKEVNEIELSTTNREQKQ